MARPPSARLVFVWHVSFLSLTVKLLSQLLILENYICTIDPDSLSPEEISKWLNLNSFAARLSREDLNDGVM
jgi:hypothetical protein